MKGRRCISFLQREEWFVWDREDVPF